MMKKSLFLMVFVLLGTTISLAQQKLSDLVVKRSGVATAKQVPFRTSMLTTATPNATKSLPATPQQANKAPRRAETGQCTVTLTIGDVWGDGSGYQMLLDADAQLVDAFVSVGSMTESLYRLCEYFIPENADFSPESSNVVYKNSVTISIPAGTYDWMIVNPSPGDRIYVAGDGYANNFTFEEGKSYEFTAALEGSHDKVSYTIDGEAPEKIKYKRPDGTFFAVGSYEDEQDGSNYGYYYLYAPNGVPLTFTNYSTNPAETSWKLGSNILPDDQVVDNNAVITYNSVTGAYLSNLPTLQKNNNEVYSYTCSEGTYQDDEGNIVDLGQEGVYVPRSKEMMGVFDDTRGSRYYGYSAPTGQLPARFGFGGIYPLGYDADGDNKPDKYGYPTSIYQYFEKPASPLYIDQVLLPIYTDKINGAYTGIPAGKELVMKFLKADGSGNITNEVLGTFTCTSEDIDIYGNFEDSNNMNIGYGSVQFYNLTEDEFGNPMIEGIVINEPFYIKIEGLNQEGVDVGFALNVISEVDAEFEYSHPTVEIVAFDDTDRFRSNAGYMAMFYINGIMDNVEVIKDGYEWLRINESDKMAYTDIDNEKDKLDAAVIIPTRPWISTEEDEDGNTYEEESYTLLFDDGTGESYDAPDWLTIQYDEDEEEGAIAFVYLIMQANNAVPAKSMKRAASDGNIIEVDGRRGRFCAISLEGLCNTSDKFFVIQGDLTHEDVLKALGITDGIQSVTATQKTDTKAKGMYNLAGQRVNKNFRGITIENGKKLIKK